MKTELLKENEPISIIKGFSKKRIEFSTLIFTDGEVRRKSEPDKIKVRGYYKIYDVKSVRRYDAFYKNATYLIKVVVKGNGKQFKPNDIIHISTYLSKSNDKVALEKVKVILKECYSRRKDIENKNSGSLEKPMNKIRKKRPNHN